MDSDTALIRKRLQILDALKEAITRFSTDTQLNTALDTDLSDSLPQAQQKLRWVQDQGEKSAECLDRFWKETEFYSTQRIPEYLQVSLYRRVDHGSEVLFTSLESFYDWLQSRSTPSECNNMLVVTVAGEVRPLDLSRSKILVQRQKRGLPSAQQVCISAAVAALLLGRRTMSYQVADLYHLLVALLPITWSDSPSFIAGLDEEELYPRELRAHYLGNPPSDLAGWHTVKTESIVPTTLSRTAVKTYISRRDSRDTAAAVPLSIITILTPLYALRIFNILARLVQGDARIRGYFKWSFFSIGISLALTSAILDIVHHAPTAATFTALTSAAISSISCMVYATRYRAVFVLTIWNGWRPRVEVHSTNARATARRGETFQIAKDYVPSLFLAACSALNFLLPLWTYWPLVVLYAVYGLASLVVWWRRANRTR